MKREKTSATVIVLICLYLLLPLLLTFLYSVFAQWTSVLPRGFTLRYFAQLFSDQRFLAALGRSVVIAVVPVLVCTAVVLLALYAVTVYLPELEKLMQVLCMIPYAIQGIVLAIGILSLYSDSPAPFSDRTVLLTAAYCIMVLPYLYQGIRNSMNAVGTKRLMETAEILGAGKLYAFFHMIVPNILSGVVISMMLSFSMAFGDFAMVNTIGGSYYETAQMYLYKTLSVSGQFSSAMIAVLFLTVLLISGAVMFIRHKNTNSGR